MVSANASATTPSKVDPTVAMRSQIDHYLDLLIRWNARYSLVSKHDLNDLEKKHVADSLSLLDFLRSSRSHFDIGSGGGFPGVPIALARPDLRIVLNDRSRNKCRFLRHVALEMNLTNVSVLEGDVAKTKITAETFDSITVRAVARPLKAWLLAKPYTSHMGSVLLQTASKLDNESFPGGHIRKMVHSTRGWITAVTAEPVS